MSTGTVEKPVTFIAFSENLSLYRKSPRPIREDGIRVGVTEPEPGESPWKIDFQDFMFTTDDPVLIEFLRGHETFNNKERGIWEQGRAPDEPQPTLADQAVAIAEASAERDTERLEAILELEKETHNRVPVIQGVEAALSAVGSSPEPGDADGNEEPSASPITSAD